MSSSYPKLAAWALAGAATGLLGPVSVLAGNGQLTADLSVEQTAQFDDNITLRPSDLEDVFGYGLEPRAVIEYSTPRWSVESDTRLEFLRWSSSALDTDNQFIELSASRVGEQTQWAVVGEFDRDSTLNEVDREGGVFSGSPGRRESVSVQPSWFRVFNSRNSLNVSAFWSDVDFSGGGFIPFESTSLNASWRYQFTPVTLTTLSVFTSGFDRVGFESDTLGAQFGVTHNFSQSLSVTALAGGRDVTTSVPIDCPPGSVNFFGFLCVDPETNETIDDPVTGNPIVPMPGAFELSDSSTGFIADATVDYTDERFELSVSASRRVSPSSIGLLLEEDIYRVRASQQLRERLWLEGTVSYRGSTAVSRDQIDFDRDFIVVEPRVRWRMAERWWLIGSVRFRQRNFNESGQSADGYAALLRVRYQHPTKTF